jgi:hypothetical protein
MKQHKSEAMIKSQETFKGAQFFFILALNHLVLVYRLSAKDTQGTAKTGTEQLPSATTTIACPSKGVILRTPFI